MLLDLQHVKAAPTAEAHARLLGQVEKHLHVDGRMAPPDLGCDVTYGELVSRGFQCIVFYPFDTADADFPGVGIGAFARRIGCWHRGGGTLRSPWPQVGTLEGLLRKLGPLCEQAGDASGFFVLQGVVTPDAAMVAAGLLGLPNRPRCLRELAEVVTPHVEAFCCAHSGRVPCIVMVDFASLSTIVPSLLSAYYRDRALPRPLEAPSTRSSWRLPADAALLAAQGAPFEQFWDPERDQPMPPRESPRRAAALALAAAAAAAAEAPSVAVVAAVGAPSATLLGGQTLEPRSARRSSRSEQATPAVPLVAAAAEPQLVPAEAEPIAAPAAEQAAAPAAVLGDAAAPLHALTAPRD